jgi:hypothetical protein
VLPVALIVLLAGEALWGAGTYGADPLSAQVTTISSGPGASIVQFELRANGVSLQLHLGAWATPGLRARPDRLYVLADPAYPSLFSDSETVRGDVGRIASYLNEIGAPLAVEAITGAEALPLLEADPHAAFAVIGLPAPDSVISNSTTFLATWVRDGGLLIWAGGPIGFASGHPSSGGRFDYDSLGWEAQLAIAGFNVTDPAPLMPSGSSTTAPAPPISAASPTALGSALATQYYATPAGANFSELESHGGLPLGFATEPGAEGGHSVRTSIAYIPVGAGGILFFGGADFSAYEGYIPYSSGWITDGTAVLSLDIALWIGLGALPSGGPSSSITVAVPSDSSVSVSLPVSTNGPIGWIAVDRTDSVLLAYQGGLLTPAS